MPHTVRGLRSALARDAQRRVKPVACQIGWNSRSAVADLEAIGVLLAP